MRTLITILLLCITSAAGTYTATTCGQSDVNAVINGGIHTAVDGDTINIPAGTCTWTTGIVVPSSIGISIIGAGTTDAHNPSGSGVTTIVDNYTSSPSWLFLFQPIYGNSLTRICCMNLTPNTGLSANSLKSPIASEGTCTASGCPNLRIDHIIFPASPDWGGLTQPSSTVTVEDNMYGVADHNSAYSAGTSYFEFLNFNNSAWLGVGQYGDNSWAQADTYGTASEFYVETNYFELSGNANLMPITEAEGGVTGLTGQGGGRVVCRFNTGVGLRSMCVNHGTESNGRPRGGRQMEFYDNSMTCPSSSYPSCFNNGYLGGAGPRSGSLLSIANTFTGIGINQFASITEYRTLQNIAPPWAGCDGTGGYDQNDGTTYYSGTISSVTGSNPYTITVSGSPGWTTNQWSPSGSPYSVHDVTITNGSEITANTSNTLSVTAWTSIAYANGDSIQILRASLCIDQSSRGAGNLLSGSTPTTGWVNEVADPVYEAADTSDHVPAFGPVTSDTGRILINRDYYAEISQTAQITSSSPFDGTAGTGYGTLAHRPSTCTTNVAYWATDQGSWNTSGSGGQGILYNCVSTNTWGTFFTPYIYPHPLVTGGGGAQVSAPSLGMFALLGEDGIYLTPACSLCVNEH